MIEVQNLHQSFGKKLVLDDVNLTIEKNEICALVGRNGAGKSTFINSLLGILPVKKGNIKINGASVSSKRKKANNEISYLPEKFRLYPLLTGMENMVFFAKAVSKDLDETRIERILKSVNLWEDRDHPINGYSKGMLQRLGLAVTLYQDSTILVLDEPTSGLDPIGRKEILDALKKLENKTILLSSHHLDEIKQLCTHVAFLEERKITKYTVEDFLQTQKLGENENGKSSY
ncbi:ABC transporter ATP-binding protein [Bacillus dakarensis]|uniref:ABC transporter ATP-binding protein n=1 Tax=Robertmurraya dakarensis TaxID=1926278 RepID=UPI0009814E3C|nr:ABC transporter ATP-binding protein [Bacillus dakarensis]